MEDLISPTEDTPQPALKMTDLTCQKGQQIYHVGYVLHMTTVCIPLCILGLPFPSAAIALRTNTCTPECVCFGIWSR